MTELSDHSANGCDEKCDPGDSAHGHLARTAPELSPAEAAIVAKFDAAEPAPESYVRQHRSEADCWCEPYAVGTLGVMTHRVVEP